MEPFDKYLSIALKPRNLKPRNVHTMKEAARITQLFEDLFAGDPWIDINLMDTLRAIPADRAAKKVIPNGNSIWEITNHLVSWRINVLEKMKGKTIVTPGNNYITPVKDVSETAWQKTLDNLAETQEKWLAYLKDLSGEDLQKVYPRNNMTGYQHIQGILQHDAYHLGQIVLLHKVVLLQ